MTVLRRSLFIRVSIAFAALALIVGALQVYLFLRLWDNYNLEAEQRVSWDLASVMAERLQPQLAHSFDQPLLQRELYRLVELNPSVDPFLLDAKGHVVAALQSGEKRDVALAPLKKFLDSKPPTGRPLKVISPNANSAEPQVFSVARLNFAGNDGYLLILLKGRRVTEARMHIGDLYLVRLSVATFIVTMLFAAALGAVVFFFITRNFHRISAVIERFEHGDYSIRTLVSGEDEVARLGNAYNRMAETIETTIAQLARSDRLRRELVANITHDIRRPLTAIHVKLQAALIELPQLNESEQRKRLEGLMRLFDGVELLIEDLFELSKLSAGERTPEMMSINLLLLVDDVCEQLRYKAAARQIALSVDCADASYIVTNDPILLERILSNLIENALVYTPIGGSIAVRLVSDANGIRLSVSDNGIGIAADDLPHLFDRFFRGRSAQDHAPSGSGLGLAIVKKISEQLGIQVSVESTLGVGTTFTLQF